MRTLSTALASHLAGRSHTRCTMLLLELRDGTSIGITDHDRDIAFDLGDGSVTYQAGTGILASDVVLQTGLDADNYEVSGPLKDDGDFTLERVVGGRFNRARAKLFQVNWKDLGSGAIKLLAGNISEARVEGGKFIFEIRSDCDRYNQVIGRLITNNCDADFGDGIRCHATPVEIGAIKRIEWLPEIVTTDGGREVRNQRRSEPSIYFDIAFPTSTRDGAAYLEVLRLFNDSMGGLHTFSFIDWTDESGETVHIVRFDGEISITGVAGHLDKIEVFTLKVVVDE